jgi:asparagine synthase (glutamine-hydrolysing)
MCGIAGVLRFKGSSFRASEPYLTRMIDAMAHRGPDGAGVWVADDHRVGLGHRRLSIIDLSTAALQPMSNHDGTVWLTFNGEIYNHAEIRAELEKSSRYEWKTDHSDTEVIVHSYEEWGFDCLEKFRGMFAFGLWDSRKRHLWLVRDRMGIKPLYYSVHNGRLAFASEIKALLRDPEQKRAVHEEAFYHFLSFLTTPAPQTLFDGIRKLPCATWLRVSEDGNIEERRYWEVWDHTQPLVNVGEAEICDQLMSELRHAVKLRKVSDVPVGVFLSGGVDSSTNAALFSEGESRPIQTFSIGYDDNYGSYPSELPYARRMAKLVHADHHERILTQQDLLDFLPRMVQLQDEPIADPVCVPVYYVSKLARDHGVIVCQLGEGADELFWGYRNWKVRLRLQQLDNLPFPRATKRLGLGALSLLRKEESLAYELLRRGSLGLPVFWSGSEAFSYVQKQHLLSPRLGKRFADYSSWETVRPIRQRFEATAWDRSIINWMTYLDLNLRLPELLLMRVDKMSMGVSLEARVPFLDHKFVELVMSIPGALKTKDGKLKYVLKKAIRGLIPDDLINRKKQGFGVPVYEWFFQELGVFASNELNSFCEQTDFLNREAVMALLNDKRHRHLAWYLLNFALWWKEYVGCEDTKTVPILSVAQA